MSPPRILVGTGFVLCLVVIVIEAFNEPGERSERSASHDSIIGRDRQSLSRASYHTSSRGDDETDNDRSAALSQRSRRSSRSLSPHRSISSHGSTRSESSRKSSLSKSHSRELRSNGPFTQREASQQQPISPHGSNTIRTVGIMLLRPLAHTGPAGITVRGRISSSQVLLMTAGIVLALSIRTGTHPP